MRLVLLGAGGHASDVLGVLEAAGFVDAEGRPVDLIGFVADGEVKQARFTGRRFEHLGSVDRLAEVGATHYMSCVGYATGRKLLSLKAEAARLRPCSLVHPRAYVPPTARFGHGTVVLAGGVLSPNTQLGAHVLVGQGAVLGHDTIIGDYTSIMPSACISGDVTIGRECLIGANATVLEKRVIADGAKVGAGAVVVHDVSAGSTVVGVPARPLSR